jgi:hypothetical protein
MRITRQQLTDLINEEISNALLERQNRRLLEDAEDAMDQDESEGPMSLDDLIDFAKKYAGLTREDRRSLDLIMDGRGEGVTPEEIRDLQIALGGYSTELDDYLEDALNDSAMYTDEDEDDGTLASAVRMNR